MRARRALRYAIPTVMITLVALLCGATAVWAWQAPSRGRTVEVTVIGDSLSTGYNTTSAGWTSYAAQLFAKSKQHVVFTNAAENGSGYAVRGDSGDTFADQARRVVTARTRIVLIFGSDNDVGQADVAGSVSKTLALVKTLAPRATVIVVGPPAPPAQKISDIAAMRDVLRKAAAAAGDRFVDPLALEWFNGETAAGVGPDEEHPNLAGERFLAGQMQQIILPTVKKLYRT